MKIYIYAQILDNNLGNDWFNNYETALALAGYTESIWREDLKSYTDRGYELSIEIDVQKNTSGVSKEMNVVIDSPTLNEYNDVVNLLTDQYTIWQSFFDSPMATVLMKED